jgi:hypothetical protein
MTAEQFNLSSSLSGAIDTLLESLRAAAPAAIYTIVGEGSEWYYDIQKRCMVRVPNGTEVQVSQKHNPDQLGRVVAQSINNDLIRIHPDRIFRVSFH